MVLGLAMPSINLFGIRLDITSSLITQWVIMVLIILLAIILTPKLTEVPGDSQNIAEIFVEFISNMVEENMGKKYVGFIPYIGTLFIFMLCMNLVGLFGIKPPTTDYNVALGMALISFIVIQSYTIKKVGIGQYFTGYGKPFVFLLPINILERVSLPLSLSLRLFGNMFAATVIMDLLYEALRGIGFIAQIGIPIPFHAYFDLFDGTLQMIIFVMLTMINIKIISEH
ncbi:F0F1 ATP synthase subunit A [Haloimpatiens sp. FM7330]|uniref:F0F1 ATP synthase subunit A n=1 Tax=Haloimpatiens sp. FM7330 TaxID=3298610 RepID=UPI003633F381